MELGNVRAKLRRATDGALIQGWIVGERDISFLFTAQTDVAVCPGDPFVCEFFALEWTVTSLAVARFINHGTPNDAGEREITVALEQVRTVSVSRGKGNERILVDGFTAALWGKSGRMANGCTVQDISRKGLSVLVPDGVEPDSEINVVVEGAGDPMTLTCQVRYCRRTKQGFRIGLMISSADRVTSAKWSQIVNDRRAQRAEAA